VIGRAAICPAPPLLARELTGQTEVLPELRAACAAAVAWLLEPGVLTTVVVGPGEETTSSGSGGRFGPVGLGAMLLDEAGWGGNRVLQSVGEDETPAACAALGQSLARTYPGAAMLVMGDGSARCSVTAPGHLHEGAAAFNARVEQALRAGDIDALAALPSGLARELMVTGRPAWQVLAAALGAARPADVHYADAPFGVFYLVAMVRPDPRARTSRSGGRLASRTSCSSGSHSPAT